MDNFVHKIISDIYFCQSLSQTHEVRSGLERQAGIPVRIPASDWQYPIIPYSQKALPLVAING